MVLTDRRYTKFANFYNYCQRNFYVNFFNQLFFAYVFANLY